MERIAIDLAPEQVVRWLLDEDRRDAFDLLVNATRSYRVGALSEEERASLDDKEDGELGETSEVGHLEVRPRREPHRWVLCVRVEDDIGPRLPEDEPVPENEEDIDLSTFFEEFIAPNRGIADVSAEAEDAAAKVSLSHILREMTTDWHKRKGTYKTSQHREHRG